MVVAIMASMAVFLDSNIMNLALPATARDLGGGLSLEQWVVDGYLLALAATILPGGSISDLFGRVPVLRFGLAAFGAGLVLAAAAAWPAMLITARLIQGLGGAFLVPGSLALINSTFDRGGRAAAIGTWTAWTGIATIIGPTPRSGYPLIRPRALAPGHQTDLHFRSGRADPAIESAGQGPPGGRRIAIEREVQRRLARVGRAA